MLRSALDLRAVVMHPEHLHIVWGHEMKITKLLAIAVLAASFGAGAAHAQNSDRTPAEFPPSSYKGKQYVDSKGCVFIRAGIDGNVSWVPRVSRARQTVCGFKPSLAGQVASAAPAAPVDRPVQITLDNGTAPRAVQAPAPQRAAQPRRVAPAAPVVVRQTAPAPAPRVVPQPVVVAAAPQIVTTTRRVQVQTACPGASPLSQQYLLGDGRSPVRCGPQTEPIVGAGYTQEGVGIASNSYGTATASINSQTRIVPKHVAENRINTRNVSVPSGYKKVWDDDRLNPYRAEQNLAGRSQMLLIWTQTVPRRLIDTRSGRDLTASVPLVYPYLDIATQSRELGQVQIVQRNGQVAKRIVRNSGVRKPVYSSRSVPVATVAQPAAPAPRALAANRYVQVGTFGNSANAQKSAQNIARMGYPARIGKHSKSGKTYLTVQAGPFTDAGQLQSAIKRLRGAGYSDAFVRN